MPQHWSPSSLPSCEFILEKSFTNQISAPQSADHLRALAKLAPRLCCRTRHEESLSPNSHHIATERVKEFTPFCAAASSKLSDVEHTSAATLARIMSCTRRSRLGAANTCIHLLFPLLSRFFYVSLFCFAFSNELLPISIVVVVVVVVLFSLSRCLIFFPPLV